MKISTVSVIGLGALGILYAHHLSRRTPNMRVVADEERIARYSRDGILCNGVKCDFHYILPGQGGTADLLIFAVKQGGLKCAIESARSQVGDNTIVLSLLNGITSERIIGEAYGEAHMLLCVAQGMDAVASGGRLTFHNLGLIAFGDREKGIVSDMTRSVAEFFTRMEVPHIVDTDMQRRMWGKLMINTGINQAVAVYGACYADAQKEGYVRDVMIAAMEEVRMLSELEGIGLTKRDIEYWLGVVQGLAPEGKPSMKQDAQAHRPTEVELFSGTVLALAKKHGVEVPVNRDLYERITAMERDYTAG